MKTFKQIVLTILCGLVILVVLYFLALAGLEVYLNYGTFPAVITLIGCIIVFIMLLGWISALVVDKIFDIDEEQML